MIKLNTDFWTVLLVDISGWRLGEGRVGPRKSRSVCLQGGGLQSGGEDRGLLPG